MYQLLFVDDDRNLLKVNYSYFTKLGFRVFTAENEREMNEVMSRQILDCIILDIMLPLTDGYELCRKIKAETDLPVIFLTSLLDESCLYKGFLEGGNDYMTKPYKPRELELRIRARIEEHKGVTKRGECLQFSSLLIDVTGRRVQVGTEVVPFTSNEFEIFLLLARTPGKAFSPGEIYREIWKLPDLETVNTVRVHVSRLRQKLEAACPEHKFLETAWGKGYFFVTKKEEIN